MPTKWRLRDLREHPDQQKLFGDISEVDLAALTADIEKRGLQLPIHILPDGTILSGHLRSIVCDQLGWKWIDAIVRHDLADDPSAAGEFFVSDNLNRRHLTRLARVRCIEHLLTKKGKRTEAIKTKVAEQLGMSLRTVNRYLLIADAPREVQLAFDRGELSLVEACRIAALPYKQLQQAAERIANGEAPRAVLRDLLTRDDGGGDRVGGSFTRFVRALRRDLPLLEPRVKQVDRRRIAASKDGLLAARKLVDRLLDRVD